MTVQFIIFVIGRVWTYAQSRRRVAYDGETEEKHTHENIPLFSVQPNPVCAEFRRTEKGDIEMRRNRYSSSQVLFCVLMRRAGR